MAHNGLEDDMAQTPEQRLANFGDKRHAPFNRPWTDADRAKAAAVKAACGISRRNIGNNVEYFCNMMQNWSEEKLMKVAGSKMRGPNKRTAARWLLKMSHGDLAFGKEVCDRTAGQSRTRGEVDVTVHQPETMVLRHGSGDPYPPAVNRG
jgi:hypothetical protein